MKFLILDGRGKFAGEPVAEGYRAIQVPAGEVTLYAEAERHSALLITCQPFGRVQYECLKAP